ncbi:MAG TPA: DUF6600 domain-containing protein [Candidatus Angelobacter sp.]|jgi:hypothetical protein
MKTIRSLAIILFAVTGLTVGAWAQDYPQQEPQGQDYPQAQSGPQGQDYPQGQSGPGSGGPSLGDGTATKSDGPAPQVARISLIHGDVSMARGDTGEWASTSINAPLVQGDQVLTGEKARTEIQLDYADLLRLAAHSQVKIADLSRNRIQVQVSQGYASLSMLKGGEADVEIDSPNVAVHPLKTGRYRIQVNSDSETDVIVRQGEAEISTPQGSTRVREGEMIAIRGTDQPEYKVSSAPPNDDWDQWNKDRDHVIRDSQSVSRTSPYYTGVNDLDSYGRWVYVPGYGNVWQPYQQAAWAPYQTGRWVWEPYYGWTWVSYEPWGWAPYHYGRWFYYGNNWCWWPGPAYIGYRPLWSPAFVFFVGFGHRAGFGFGSIGWFPVGPHDPFFPWYGRGFNRVNVVNITNITVINRGGRGAFIPPLAVRGRQPFFSNANLALTNPRVRGSITSVSAENFGRGGNEGWRHGVEEHELRASSVMTGNVPVVPSRESLHAGKGTGGVPAGVQPHSNDRFFTKHQPPAGPESFHTQVQRVQRVVGPEAAGGSGGVNVRTGGSGGANVRTGNAEVPRAGVAASGGGNSGGMNPKDSPGRMAPGSNEGMTQNRPSGNSGSSTGASGGNSEHSGWNKFDSPTGHSSSDVGSGHSEQTPSGSRSPSGGNRQSVDRPSNDRPSVDRPSIERPSNDRQSIDRQAGTNQTPHTQENGSSGGGWQRFPSNSDHASTPQATRNDQGGNGGSKPPLELHRPIVTPREPNGNSSPSPRSEPRYNPPSPRNDSRSASPAPRSGPSRSSGAGGSYHSNRGSSSRGGSSSHGSGGHSESKSSSGSRH